MLSGLGGCGIGNPSSSLGIKRGDTFVFHSGCLCSLFLPYSTLPVTRTTLFVVNYYLVEISHSTFFPAHIDNPRFKRMCKNWGCTPLRVLRCLGTSCGLTALVFKNFAQFSVGFWTWGHVGVAQERIHNV